MFDCDLMMSFIECIVTKHIDETAIEATDKIKSAITSELIENILLTSVIVLKFI